MAGISEGPCEYQHGDNYVMGKEHIVAQISLLLPNEEEIANGHLIATASDLLTEAEDWHTYLFETGNYERAEQVAAVIAKARGEG